MASAITSFHCFWLYSVVCFFFTNFPYFNTVFHCSILLLKTYFICRQILPVFRGLGLIVEKENFQSVIKL